MLRLHLAYGFMIIVALSSVSPLRADSKESDGIKRGRATFQKFCSVCHGDRGDGKNQSASALTPRPANLRTLTKRFGTFPAAHVRAVITGQDDAEHTPAMRAWSAMLLVSTEGDEAAASRKLDDVVAYIESIQQK
jgi:mono/diheme cytochrome c family protein